MQQEEGSLCVQEELAVSLSLAMPERTLVRKPRMDSVANITGSLRRSHVELKSSYEKTHSRMDRLQ